MGGSSIFPYSFVRGSRHDYDDWAAMGNKGWSWKEVLPFFLKYEENRDLDVR